MTFHLAKDVRLLLPQAALTVIFDECDGFDQAETGGRVIGTFKEDAGKLALHITGIIEAGPQARRTAVSFFQDGEHQERIFRRIESSHPEIEHLGNWHTHHVNGLSTLSSGDIATYRRTVSHQNHNIPFFYALLVVGRLKTKNPLRRYSVKHYIFRRDDDRVYEIPQRLVKIANMPLVWPSESVDDPKHGEDPATVTLDARARRVYDRDILVEFYQGMRAFTSPKLGLYWRGSIELLDGSTVQVLVLERVDSGVPTYSVSLRASPATLKGVAEELAMREFPSARAALIMTERTCNRTLYEQREHTDSQTI